MMLSCVLLMLSNDVAIKLFFYNPQDSLQQRHHLLDTPLQTLDALLVDMDKHKCTINNIVLDSCIIANKWHQSATLIWYDCPICAKMIKCMNAQSMLRQCCPMFYKTLPRTTCQDILLCKKEVHLTPMKLDESISSWHDTNIGVVCGKSLRMSTPSRNQSLAMGEEDYFLWCKMMERRQ
ncbi:hypothetical protein AAG906_007538 [Vitis piasezkii]